MLDYLERIGVPRERIILSVQSKADLEDYTAAGVCERVRALIYGNGFYGKRVHRGLYRFSDGRIVNADVNGAANILRKSKQNFDFEGLCRGLLASPLRIRVS